MCTQSVCGLWVMNEWTGSMAKAMEMERNMFEFEMGRKPNKHFNSRRDGITCQSHESQRLQMEVGWSCSQGGERSHMGRMHERLDTTWKEKTRKTKGTMGRQHQAGCRTQLNWKGNRQTSMEEHEGGLYPSVESWRLPIMMVMMPSLHYHHDNSMGEWIISLSVHSMARPW